jgi:hypothetical protein
MRLSGTPARLLPTKAASKDSWHRFVASERSGSVKGAIVPKSMEIDP